MGWKDLSCYGSSFYETPNLDKLASEGTRFTDAYAASPVCSPTRASILTGKYPASVGVTDFIDWKGSVHPASGYLIDAPYIDHLSLSEKSLATTLRNSGYRTWHVGKWHLGGKDYYPENHGFDINLGGCEWGYPQQGYFSPWGIETLEDGPPGEYLTDRLTEEAIRLISTSRDKPFFLNLWYYSVHIPIQAKKQDIQRYEAKARNSGLDEMRAFAEGGFFPCNHKKNLRVTRRLIQSDPIYAAMINCLDQNIGRLLEALKVNGLADDTVIIFTSDNGGLATAEGSPTCNSPLAEGKGWMYEGGTREPLIIKWPGLENPISVCSVPVTSTDFYPTVLDIAGIDPLPEQHSDGVSICPLLKGDREFKREAIYWHYPHYGNQGGTPGASVRDGDWKLIRFFEDGHEELYNLREDIGETKNLSELQPAKRVELSSKLSAWQEQIEARIPETNPKYAPWSERERPGHFAGKK